MPSVPTPHPEHSAPRSLALHLVPGALATLAYVILSPALIARGYPALFTLLLATLGVLIPIELGILLHQARRANGQYSMAGVVMNREPVSRRDYLVWPLGLALWGLFSSALASPLDTLLRERAFAWLPSWFFVSSLAEFSAYSHGVRVATFVLGLVVGGIIGPIVEELYFRGYLLPRLSRFGRWAPLLHATLFSLYHFWTPWQNPSRLLLSAAMSYLTWWKRNLYLAMVAHCALNAIIWSLTFAPILR